jgi:hypothetical protein
MGAIGLAVPARQRADPCNNVPNQLCNIRELALPRSLRGVSSCLVLLLAAACGGGDSSPPTQPAAGGSEQVRAYLGHLVDLMQANSLHRFTIDWTEFRTRVLAEGASAQTIADGRPAIRLALQLLGDGHSFYQATDGTLIRVPTRACAAGPLVVGDIPADIGYVRVGSFSGSAAQATAFARTIQQSIVDADRDGLAGWIVDLRNNGGGNMWPMIAGVGPILGEGVAGYFIDPRGDETSWGYENGSSNIDGVRQVSVPGPYRLRREGPRVAVLSDNGIASSGEATLIAFRARSNTRSFGTPTCGLSTSNRGYSMSDGATLQLTVAVMADRARTKYGDSIPPDEVVADSEVVVRAIAWLRSDQSE